MSNFKIEYGIPMPKRYPKALEKYPFGELEVNDSFFVRRNPSEKIDRLKARIYTARTKAKKIYGGKYETRVVQENGAQGIRVWRIE